MSLLGKIGDVASSAVKTVGKVAGAAVNTVGKVATTTIGTAGKIAGTALNTVFGAQPCANVCSNSCAIGNMLSGQNNIAGIGNNPLDMSLA